MTASGSAARGRRLLAERMARTPDHVASVPEHLAALLTRPAHLPRALVTTGIGTSEGHARHLAELAARTLGLPARFASTGSLAAGPSPGAEQDWLVVFSQGLSANARHALRHVEAYRGVVLVTGLSPEDPDPSALSDDKRAWLAALERRGVVRVELGCGPEYGALLRVIGARVGYAIAWSLLRTLALRRLDPEESLAVSPAALRRAQEEAPREAARVLPPTQRVADFFAPERTLLLVGEGGSLELVDHLALKVAEGMLRPQPRAVDVLHFAHGPLQSLARAPVSILYLAPGGGDSPWLARLAATLDPALHDLRCVRTRLPMPFAALELEAIFDAWILRHQDETGTDLVAWPGAERERALYDAGPELDAPAVDSSSAASGRYEIAPAPIALERATWPELERALEAGRRTALVPLGSIEQHGPHLPLATDRWIADALAVRLAARLEDAVVLPAVPFGCASEHLDFTGTLHVEPATLEAILRDLLASLRRHGFERAFLFTAHGGNHDALRAMRERLVAGALPLELAFADGVDVGRLQEDVVAVHGLDPRAAGAHAGEYETSLVAWLEPGAVRFDALAAGILVAEGGSQELFYPSLRPNAPTGVVGDPTRAARGRGEAYLAAWVDALERAYRAAFDEGREKNRNATKGAQKA